MKNHLDSLRKDYKNYEKILHDFQSFNGQIMNKQNKQKIRRVDNSRQK